MNCPNCGFEIANDYISTWEFWRKGGGLMQRLRAEVRGTEGNYRASCIDYHLDTHGEGATEEAAVWDLRKQLSW